MTKSVTFSLPVSGETIMETFGLKPSKEIGIIKEFIKEAILEGVIPNDPQKAFELMLKKGTDLGLTALMKNRFRTLTKIALVLIYFVISCRCNCANDRIRNGLSRLAKMFWIFHSSNRKFQLEFESNHLMKKA